MPLSIAQEIFRAIKIIKDMHSRRAKIRTTLQALPDMIHAVVDMISLSRIPCVRLVLRCIRFMTVLRSATNVIMVMVSVVVFVELHAHHIQTVEVVEDVEGKVVLARYGVLVFVFGVGEEGILGYLLWRDGRVLILQKLVPCGIDGWARFSEVEWKLGVHLPVYSSACLVEE